MEESLNRKMEVLSVRQEKLHGEPEDAPEKKGPGEEQDPDSFRRKVMATFGVRDTDIRSYSPLALAFLGDGIYSAVIRTLVVEKGNRQAAKLHREASVLVCAEAQAKVGDAIFSDLTEEEARRLVDWAKITYEISYDYAEGKANGEMISVRRWDDKPIQAGTYLPESIPVYIVICDDSYKE